MHQKSIYHVSLNMVEVVITNYLSWRFWNKKNKILVRKILCFTVKENLSVGHLEGWVLIGIKFLILFSILIKCHSHGQ